MITVNMHEAKSRLSELVAIALKSEEVIACSHGEPRVRLVPVGPAEFRRDLIAADPKLRATLAADYDPAEPLTVDEWPPAGAPPLRRRRPPLDPPRSIRPRCHRHRHGKKPHHPHF